MKRIFLGMALAFCTAATAQVRYSLQQCIDTALARNISVQQASQLMEVARVNWQQSRANQLPLLSLDLSHGANFGRSIDPFTNTYVNQSVNRAGYGLATDVVLFNGGSMRNTVKSNAASYEASRMDWQQIRDGIVLNVIVAYLNVLSGEDVVRLAERQGALSRVALQRIEVLNSQGAVRPSDVTDLKGQLMGDELNLVNARTQLESSKLLLLQWMNKPYDSSFAVERTSIDAAMQQYKGTAAELFAESLNSFAAVKAASLRITSAQYAVKAARGGLFPVISFGAGLNTNYSSVARDAVQEKIPYTNQLKNNRFSSIGVGLSVPIFNRSIARNRVRVQEINLQAAGAVAAETQRQLREAIDANVIQVKAAYSRYEVLGEQVKAYTESFRAAEVRFTAGVGSSVDYLMAKDRLDRAQINWLNAQYDFVLRKKMLDFYRGER